MHACTQIKVLSDIDDTILASYKDHSFPGGSMYPGVIALYQALQAGADLMNLLAIPDVTVLIPRI